MLGFLLGLAFGLGPTAQAGPKVLQPRLFDSAPEASARTARFAFIGDSGTRKVQQLRVARAMQAHDAIAPFGALFMLGDNVYPDGGRPHFRQSIGKPYAPLLEHGIRIFGVLGNHDIRRERGRAQLRYLGNEDRRWYTTRLPGTEVEIFALDTNLLVDPVANHFADHPGWARAQASEQLRWFDKALASSNARLKVVVGHHPLYSGNAADRKPERDLMRSAIEATMVRHGVTAYLSGHDHTYARSQPIDGITHFVAGGGGQPPEKVEEADYPRAAASPDNHFVVFEARDDVLHFETHDVDNRLLDQGELRPPLR